MPIGLKVHQRNDHLPGPKKMTSTKYDVVIKAKATSTRIVDISNVIVGLESNDKGQVTGKHYSGLHWDIVESTMLADGSAPCRSGICI
jgi:hypothetical protein